jgi:hypothetical protein
MNITCPYCYSANVSRATSASGNNSFSSMAGAGLVQALPKVCLHHFTIIGWISWAVVGGLIDSLVQPSQPQQPTAYFHCNNCQCNFN